MTTEETVRDYFRCLDQEDWEGMRRLWTEDAELRAVGGRPRSGREEVLGFFEKLFAPWTAHEDRPTRLIIAGDVVTAEVLFLGTTAEGREVNFEAIDLFDLHDGQIARMSNWYDIAYARKALSA
jgi:ketosteroid isomerase-like protein